MKKMKKINKKQLEKRQGLRAHLRNHLKKDIKDILLMILSIISAGLILSVILVLAFSLIVYSFIHGAIKEYKKLISKGKKSHSPKRNISSSPYQDRPLKNQNKRSPKGFATGGIIPRDDAKKIMVIGNPNGKNPFHDLYMKRFEDKKFKVTYPGRCYGKQNAFDLAKKIGGHYVS